MENFTSEIEDKYKYLEKSVNYITDYKTYLLPINVFENECCAVELILVNNSGIRVESAYHPIRFGKHCGSSVVLGQSHNVTDFNPKFFWNGREWILNTFGYFHFCEIEINPTGKYENP